MFFRSSRLPERYVLAPLPCPPPARPRCRQVPPANGRVRLGVTFPLGPQLIEQRDQLARHRMTVPVELPNQVPYRRR